MTVTGDIQLVGGDCAEEFDVVDGEDTGAPRKRLALVGKTYCKVDAGYAPVEVGDPLTTSPTRGHAMKADAHDKPFGAPRNSGTNLGTDHLFTSQVQDQSTGLYWYGSRAYDASVGRFLCPDSIVPSAGNPQSLNRFSYALNNPIVFRDPSGHSVSRADYTDDTNGWTQYLRDEYGDTMPSGSGGSYYALQGSRISAGFGQSLGGWGMFGAGSRVDEVIFVGGFNTDDLRGTSGEWDDYAARLTKAGIHYDYYDWGEPIDGRPASDAIPVDSQAAISRFDAFVTSLSGTYSHIGLIGHSKGGSMIFAYLATLGAQGRLPGNVTAAAAMSSPLSGPLANAVGLDWSNGRFSRLTSELPSVRLAVIYNHADVISTPGPAAFTVDYNGQFKGLLPTHGEVLHDPSVIDYVAGTLMGAGT